MKIDLDNLPSDVDLLRQLVVSLAQHSLSLEDELLRLREQLKLLRAKQYGKSSEKLDGQIAEVENKIEECEALTAIFNTKYEMGNDTDQRTESEKNTPKRQKLPDHLERIDEVLEPELKCAECDCVEFRKIADDISETLEYIPSSFKVIRHIRPRFACVNCEEIVQAYPASKPIAKGMAGPGLLAHILVQKYGNHLPFYRQSEIYAREDIDLSRSTLAGWAGQCAALLEPLVAEIRKTIFASSHIHGDDTYVKVLAPGLGKTKTGRIWSYVRDGRKCGDETPPAVCYFYSPDRKGIRPEEHLKEFRGVFHADAYSGYNNVYIDREDSQGTITEAACWAHTRRKFYEIAITNPEANIAMCTLEEIGKIYEVEESISGLDPDKRYKQRQERSKDLVDRLFENWKEWRKGLSKKSVTGLAINYALNNEEALKRFLEDGRIEIDNNAAERAMRSIAVGRKNWLFAGSDRGGETAASIYTITETAKLNGINPWRYLQQVLSRIQDHKANKIADLLPWNITST